MTQTSDNPAVSPAADSQLYLIHLRKDHPMESVNDPHNTAVKPGLSTLEGKIAAFVVVVTVLGPIITALAGAMPDNQYVQMAVAILAALTSILVALGYMKKRSDVKETANREAAGLALADKTLAMADKAIAVAKENQDLAVALLKSAGIAAVPPVPAAVP